MVNFFFGPRSMYFWSHANVLPLKNNIHTILSKHMSGKEETVVETDVSTHIPGGFARLRKDSFCSGRVKETSQG